MKTTKTAPASKLTAAQLAASKAEFKEVLKQQAAEQAVAEKMGIAPLVGRTAAPAPAKVAATKATKPKAAAKPAKAVKKAAAGKPLPVIKKSRVDSPVALVWDLCDKHPTAKRKEILAMAAAKGVATNTAASQYQYWRAAGKAAATQPATRKATKGK